MMKQKITIAAVCCIGLISSCQFSEECNYTGNVECTMDWDSLWGDLQKPDTLTALFYHSSGNVVSKELLGDTIFQDIPSGNTELITYNHPAEIECKGLESITDAELHLPTYFEGNARAVKEAPMICSIQNNLYVPIEGTTSLQVSPLPIVKQLMFVVNVIKDGVIGNLESCNASLSGIATCYSLYRKEPVYSKATVFFSLEKGKGDTFNHKFFVLGVNPPKDNQEEVSKKLSITIVLDDGQAKSVDIDLTEQLNQFTSNIFQCEVDVKISSLATEIEISDWKQGHWNQITIQ